jgi:ribosomal-protein-alanine N-acetyltransferase
VSAQLDGRAVPNLQLVPMGLADLDAVLAIETEAYEFPWTRGNFIDSLAAGYHAVLLRERGVPAPAGYLVAMHGAGEVHLLNLTVAPAWQGRGLALRLLGELVRHGRELRAHQVWLEVRESNTRARSIYLRYGMRQIGVRKGYYPAAAGRREDAIVMGLSLDALD